MNCCANAVPHFHFPQQKKQQAAAAESEPIDSFARPSGNVVMKRKGDDDDFSGGWGGARGGGGGGGGWGGKGGGKMRSTGKGSAMAGRATPWGKALEEGTYGEAAGRTFAVLEVRRVGVMYHTCVLHVFGVCVMCVSCMMCVCAFACLCDCVIV